MGKQVCRHSAAQGIVPSKDVITVAHFRARLQYPTIPHSIVVEYLSDVIDIVTSVRYLGIIPYAQSMRISDSHLCTFEIFNYLMHKNEKARLA